MNRSESIGALALALSKAQAEMISATKDAKNPFFQSKYADLSAVVEAIKYAFGKNELSYSQFPTTEQRDDGSVIVSVLTILMHSSGEWMQDTLSLSIKKNDPQSVGSAISYSRRYSLQSIAGVSTESDDDGEQAMCRDNVKVIPKQAPKQKQNKEMLEKIASSSINDLATLWGTLTPQEQRLYKDAKEARKAELTQPEVAEG